MSLWRPGGVLKQAVDRGMRAGIWDGGLGASNLQAFRLLIERSGGGVTCRTDDEYVDAILRILNDEQYRSTMQKSIRNYVGNRAGWSHIADRHVDVYHRVVTVPYGKGRYVYFPEGP